MVQILFQEAVSSVNVNGVASPPFKIERGVRQGCPLAPYLFIIVGEALNTMIKVESVRNNIKGIRLPGNELQQTLAQYADDTSFTLLGEELPVRNMISLLDVFCRATGLLINWTKSSGYWKYSTNNERPPWTNDLGITWANNADVSKLLGAPFGMTLKSKGIDDYLVNRVSKNLKQWSSIKLNPTGRSIIANHVLLSVPLFFL